MRMKIKTLTIKNIASIEHAVIDFAGGQLGDQDLFLICGPTGAGKTTILDAICLALFNDTPRIHNSSSDKINEFGESAHGSVKDVLNLVRKNAVDAMAMLTFEVDGHEYTTKWEVFRSGQRRGGKEASTFTKLSLEEKISRALKRDWTLIYDTGESTNNDNELRKRIPEIIKMNFDQFCKTTMLAQGDFTKFLSSNAADKARILEKLVGTEIYAEVGSVINSSTNDARNDAKVLADELERFKFLNDDERAAKEAQIAQLAEKAKQTAMEKAQVDKKIKWIEDAANAADASAKAEESLLQAREALATDEVKIDQEQVEMWDATADLRQAISSRQACEKALADYRAKRESLAKVFDEASEGILFVENEIERLRGEVAAMEGEISSQRQFEQMFASADVICSKHAEIERNNSAIAAGAVKISSLDAKLKTLDSELDIKQQAKTKAETEIKKKEEAIEALNGKLNDLGAETIDTEAESVNSAISLIAGAERSLRSLNEARAEATEKQKHLDDSRAQVEPQQKSVDELKAKAENAAASVQKSKERYDKMLLSVGDHASALRATLAAGDKCPVCGSVVNELLSEDTIKSSLKPLEDELRADETALKDANEALSEARVSLNTAIAAVKTSQDDFDRAKKKADSLMASLQEERAKLSIADEADFCSALATLRSAREAEAEAIKKRQAEIKTARAEIGKIDQNIKNIRSDSLAPADKAIADIKAEREKLSTQKSALLGEAESCRKSIAALTAEIDGLINPAWRPSDEARYFEEFKAAADSYSKTKKGIETASASMRELSQSLSLSIRCREAVLREFQAWAEREASGSREIKDLASRWADLRAKAQTLSEGITGKESELSEANKKITSFCETHPDIPVVKAEELMAVSTDELTKKRARLAELKEAVAKALALRDDAKRRLVDFNESPLVEGETKESLELRVSELNALVEQCSAERGSIQQELAADAQNRALHGKKKEELDRKREIQAEWETLNKYLGGPEGKNFRNIAQSFVLSELLDKANAYLANISSRYTLFCYPGTLTIMLRDAYQGGAERATNTLSGGESFIISLSLALGLSSMQNVDFEVDTLFIDEGFGTLSPEFLDPVITALKRLHETYGRRVGIISHVDTLKQRIRASIEVTKRGTSPSQITIKVS